MNLGHVPHLFIPGPWSGDTLEASDVQLHHLKNVLRHRDGEPCTYTDGAGVIGNGTLHASAIERGVEESIDPPPKVVVAVAPPLNRDRLRFLVEKAAELGAERVRWLATRFGEGRPPRPDKARQWAVGALEQSRGAHLTAVDDGLVTLDRLDGLLVAADRAGTDPIGLSPPVTVLIGPEGGWAPGELSASIPMIRLGDRVLRTETAAILAVHTIQRHLISSHEGGGVPRPGPEWDSARAPNANAPLPPGGGLPPPGGVALP